jgi:uncharacterized DUF497 family protein
MRIERLVWFRQNVEKLAEHGVSRDEVEDVVDQDMYTVDRRREYPDQVRVTGCTRAGRWLTIALEDLGDDAYRPVTGWDATHAELEDYREKMQ